MQNTDWDYDTKYYDDCVYAQDTWNGYKSGVIREDTIFIIQDLFVTDFNNANSAIGYYDVVLDVIRFNDYYWVSGEFQSLSATERKATATHEFGHALCLDENPYNTEAVMYRYRHSNTSLDQDDKDSYDDAADNWVW